MMMVAMCVKLVMEQQLWAAPLCLSQVGHADSSTSRELCQYFFDSCQYGCMCMIQGGNHPCRCMDHFIMHHCKRLFCLLFYMLLYVDTVLVWICSYIHSSAHTWHDISFPAAIGSSPSTLIVVTDPADNDNDVFPVDNRTAVTLGATVGPPLLRCVGGHGSRRFSAPSVVWVRNGEQVVADGRITITESVTLIVGNVRRNSDLTITNFGFPDAGVYQCIFTDVDSDAEVITTIPLRLDTGLCWTLREYNIWSPPALVTKLKVVSVGPHSYSVDVILQVGLVSTGRGMGL